jgi:hypothetical protein
MLKKYAKKLHPRDQVMIKKSKEIVDVIKTEEINARVFIYVTTKEGYVVLNHKEVR